MWIWGGQGQTASPPDLLSGAIIIGSISFPVYRIALIGLGLLAAIGLYYFQEKTRYGAIIRAGMDDKEMTTGLGVNYRVAAIIVFVLGAFMGGLAGFIGLPVLGIFPGMSWSILLLALATIVIGGVGYIQGALLGATVIGLIDSFGKVYFPDFSLFTIYLAMIIVLLVRPRGLLGRAR